jgi:hypothetical protein
MIYSLVHLFISQVIEGDELYTKVNKNVPQEESEGWTILLMERASRFIWALGCGKKDRTLFFYAVQILRNVIEQTQDITLITDGERRYGNLLFEICCEVFHSGLRGRPPKVFERELKLELKIRENRIVNGVGNVLNTKHPMRSILELDKILATPKSMPTMRRHLIHP